MVCIHLLLNWALDGCEWAALHRGHSTAPERALSTYYRVGGFWADMDAVDKRNIFGPHRNPNCGSPIMQPQHYRTD